LFSSCEDARELLLVPRLRSFGGSMPSWWSLIYSPQPSVGQRVNGRAIWKVHGSAPDPHRAVNRDLRDTVEGPVAAATVRPLHEGRDPLSDDRPLWEEFAQDLEDGEDPEDYGEGSYSHRYPARYEAERLGFDVLENRRLARGLVEPPQGSNVPDLVTEPGEFDQRTGQYRAEVVVGNWAQDIPIVLDVSGWQGPTYHELRAVRDSSASLYPQATDSARRALEDVAARLTDARIASTLATMATLGHSRANAETRSLGIGADDIRLRNRTAAIEMARTAAYGRRLADVLAEVETARQASAAAQRSAWGRPAMQVIDGTEGPQPPAAPAALREAEGRAEPATAGRR